MGNEWTYLREFLRTLQMTPCRCNRREHIAHCVSRCRPCLLSFVELRTGVLPAAAGIFLGSEGE